MQTFVKHILLVLCLEFSGGKHKSSQTLKIGKKAFYNQTEMKISDAYKYASEIMIENMMNKDSEEGINAFIEKRKPKWK